MPITHIPTGNRIAVDFTLVQIEALLGEDLTGRHYPHDEAAARRKLLEAHAALLAALAGEGSDD